jgi:hypothetical protein
VDDIYKNYEEYQFKGVEFEVVNTFIENLTLTGSASFMTSKDNSVLVPLDSTGNPS